VHKGGTKEEKFPQFLDLCAFFVFVVSKMNIKLIVLACFLYKMLYIYNIIIIIYMKGRKIYNRIDVLRKEKDMTRKELAQEIGVNFQTVGYLEREEYNPSLDLAFRIAEFFGLSVDQVFSTKPMPTLSELLNKNRED